MAKLVAYYSILMGVLQAGTWGVLALNGSVAADLADKPLETGFLLLAELLTAVAMIAGGAAILAGRKWGESLNLAALGMMLYCTIFSTGVFAQMEAWPAAAWFVAVASMTAAGIVILLRLGQMKKWIGAASVRLLSLLALFGLLLGVYLFAIRPGQLHWGAMKEEVLLTLPGDEFVTNPTFKATRAVTIEGTPEEIWPWLVQIGYGRAGFYGYDLFENLGSPTGIHSANRIIPELQGVKAGDPLPIFPGATMSVQAIEPNRYFVWVGYDTPSDMTLSWALIPLGSNHTRLISRVQFLHKWNSLFEAGQIFFTEFLDHLAIRKVLLGIKGRVEGHTEPMSIQTGEIATFVIATLEVAAAFLLIMVRKHWQRAWLTGLFAGVVLLIALYAHAPYWVSALLEAFVFIILIGRFPEASEAEMELEIAGNTV